MSDPRNNEAPAVSRGPDVHASGLQKVSTPATARNDAQPVPADSAPAPVRPVCTTNAIQRADAATATTALAAGFTFFGAGAQAVAAIAHRPIEELESFIGTALQYAPGAEKAANGAINLCLFRPLTDAEIDGELEPSRRAKAEREGRVHWPLSAEAREHVRQHGYRRGEYCTSVAGLTLDIDRDSSKPLERDPSKWPCRVIGYSSHGFDAQRAPGKHRGIVQFDRACSYQEAKRIARWLESKGLPNAYAKTPTQPAFLPTCPHGKSVETFVIDRPVLCVDDVLAQAPDLPKGLANAPDDAVDGLKRSRLGQLYLKAVELGTPGLAIYHVGEWDGGWCVYVRSPLAGKYTSPGGENHFGIIASDNGAGGITSFHQTDKDAGTSGSFAALREMQPGLAVYDFDMNGVLALGQAAPANDQHAGSATSAAEASGAVPREDMSGLQLHPATGLPWVLRDKQACWVHAIDGEGYGRVVAKSDVRLEATRTLNRCLTLTDRKGNPISEAEFEQLYVQRAAEVVQTYTARTSTFEPGNRRLTLAALTWAKLAPQRHADVEGWLKALAVNDEQLERLNQWLAALTALDRPAPILHIHGPRGIGKDLFVHGIAALWSAPPSLIDESLSDFNEASASMPLIWGNEQLPAGTDFGWLRHAATARTRSVNAKYLSKYAVDGCARLVLMSNDPDILRFVRTGVMKRDDLDAVLERMLVIDASASDAREVLSRLDTTEIAKKRLAEHCLWLAQTIPLEPSTSRMCARPYGGEKPLEAHAGQRNAKVLRLVAGILSAVEGEDGSWPQAWDGAAARGLRISGGQLLVNVQHLAQAADPIGVGGKAVELEQAVRDFCDVYATGANSQKSRIRGEGRIGKALWWRALDLSRVVSAAQTLD